MTNSPASGGRDDAAETAGYFGLLWTAVGAITASLPVTGLLDAVLPLYRQSLSGVGEAVGRFGPGFSHLDTDAIRAAAVIASVVVFLLTIASRFSVQRRPYDDVVHSARVSVMYGFAAMLAFWIGSRWMPHSFAYVVDAGGQSLMALAYILIFVFLTRACALLAVNDYVNRHRRSLVP